MAIYPSFLIFYLFILLPWLFLNKIDQYKKISLESITILSSEEQKRKQTQTVASGTTRTWKIENETQKAKINSYLYNKKSTCIFMVTFMFFQFWAKTRHINHQTKCSYGSNASLSGSNNYSQSQSKSLSDEHSSAIFLDTKSSDSSDKVWQLNWYLSQANLRRFTSH